MQNRQQVIDTAVALFKEKGYEAVTVNEICKASGIAYGTFFNHFKSKGNLLWEYMYGSLAVDQSHILALKEKTALAKLMAIVTVVSQVPTQMGAPLLMQFLTLRFQNVEYWRKYESLFEQGKPVYCELIATAQADGDILNPGAPADLLDAMHDLMLATHTAWAADPSFDFPSRFAGRIETLLNVAPDKRRYTKPETPQT